MQKNDLCIDILGTRIVIAAKEDPAYLEELLNYYRRMVADTQKKTGLSDPLKVAVLTGYQLCDEIKTLLRRERQREAEENEAAQIAQDIMSRIDEVVDEGAPSP